MNNYRLVLSYNGTHFYGYQKQKNKRTVEGVLTSVINKIFSDVNKLVGAGRTDSGVHATWQVVNFKTSKFILVAKLQHALNSLLPSDIRILNIDIVDLKFDSRRSAVSREYRYLFSTCDIPVQYTDYCLKVNCQFDASEMNDVAQMFVGKHDFVNFRKKGSNEKSTTRRVNSVMVSKKKITDIYSNREDMYYYELHIVAESYLYRMVRNIMGALFQVGLGKFSKDDLLLYFKKNREGFKYSAAPAKGLTLSKVNY